LEKFELIAKSLHGLENILAEELTKLGAEGIEKKTRAVKFIADKKMMYQANLKLRTALRILKPMFEFTARNENQLYKGMQQIDWLKHLNNNNTFAIETVTSSDYFTHTKFISQKAKDAIVDQFRKKTGSRPSVDLQKPDLRINLYISNENCSVLFDSSSEPLFKRGYREVTLEAPINEVLAAGMILLSKWDGKSPFIDPMCGSGTIPIEAALIALDIAPAIFRSDFGFQRWHDFDLTLWKSIKQEAVEHANEQLNSNKLKIYGSDISPKAVYTAKKNINNCRLSKVIEIKQEAFQKLQHSHTNGTLITNPPYGERLEQPEIEKFYGGIGDILKQNFAGFDAWIISLQDALKNIRLKPSQKYTLYNGSLECKLYKYQMYAGSKNFENINENENKII